MKLITHLLHITLKFVLAGAGIYVTNSQLSYSSLSLPNNSIITTYTGSVGRYRYRYSYRYHYRYSIYRRMGFYCCSNSTSGSTGSFIGRNGNTYSGSFSVEHYSSSHSYAGCMHIYLDTSHYSQNYLSSSEEGIYTCRMPDSTGRNIDVNVGIYRHGYGSEFILFCTSTLVCCYLILWSDISSCINFYKI